MLAILALGTWRRETDIQGYILRLGQPELHETIFQK